MHDNERRNIGNRLTRMEVQKQSEGESHLVGYAAVFYRADDAGTEFRLMDDLIERVMPGAFDEALRSDDVRGLFNHDDDHLLGRTGANTMQLIIDDVGLRYDITLPKTQFAADLAESIRRGDISGSSFGFRVRDRDGQEFRSEGDVSIRELRNLRLFDVGPVTFEAYKATSTEIAKRSLAAYRAQHESEIEDLRRHLKLRELGASHGGDIAKNH